MKYSLLLLVMSCMMMVQANNLEWHSRRRGYLNFKQLVKVLPKMRVPKAIGISIKVCEEEIGITDLVSDVREFRHCVGYLAAVNIAYGWKNVSTIDWNDLMSGFFGVEGESMVRVEGETMVRIEQNAVTFRGEVSHELPYPDIACQLHVGSFRSKPYLNACVLDNITLNKTHKPRGNDRGLQQCNRDLVLLAPSSRVECIARIAYYTAAWLFTNLNYALIIFSCIFVITPATYLSIKKKRKAKYSLLFAATNVLWMAWRLQENFNWYSKWQMTVPYVCVATNTLRYLMEGVALAIFSMTSLERYFAIAGSFVRRIKASKVSGPCAAAIIGAITGGLCSLLNILVLYFMTSPTALLLQSCNVRGAQNVSLVPLIVAKVLSLLLMYLVPCAVMSGANIAVSRSICKKNKQKMFVGRSSRKKLPKKTKVISGFLVFSSLFMVCCVSKPMFEVYVALSMHVTGAASAERDAVGLMLDVITWNLTTLAYVINTVLGLRYTK